MAYISYFKSSLQTAHTWQNVPICNSIYQTHLTNANEHYNTYDPVYSLHSTPRVITFVDERQKASKPGHIEVQ